VLLWNLGGGSLLNSDDAIYASMARDALRSGDYMTFRYLGEVVHEKPPLFLWMVSACFSVLGIDDLAARLPDAICALGLLLTVGLLVRGRGAVVAVVFLLSSSIFYFNARRVMTDMPFWLFSFMFLMVLATSHEPRATSHEPRATARLARFQRACLAGLLAGLAFMTKGAAFAPVALAAVGWFLLTRQWRKWGWKDGGLLLTTFLAVAGWWHGYQVWQHGWDFVRSYLGYHAVSRIASSLITDTGPGFYVERLFELEGPPYTLLLLAGLVGAFVAAVRALRGEGRDLDVLLACFVAVYVTLLLVMRTRLEHYLLPLLVVSAVYVGRGAEVLASRVSGRGWVRVSATALLLLLGVVFFGYHNGFHMLSGEYSKGRKMLAVDAAASGGPIVSFNEYDVATHWYADRPVHVWSTDHRLCSILDATDMLVRSAYHWCPADRMEMARRLERDKPVVIAHEASLRELNSLSNVEILARVGNLVSVEVSAPARR